MITVETVIGGKWGRHGGIKSMEVVENSTTRFIER